MIFVNILIGELLKVSAFIIGAYGTKMVPNLPT